MKLFCKTFLVLLILTNVERYVSLAESITFPGQEPYRAYASSGASPGTLVYRLISLTSSDETVTYSIIKSDSSNPNLFAIDSSSGIITNAAPYPASQSQYNLVVQAGLTNGSSVNANLTVHIVPVYETTPKFEHDAYTVYISENGDVDELVTITQAFSLVITNTKMYALVGGNTGGAFYIETSGVIYTKTSLNREDNSQYSLTVRYVDDSGSADTQVQVNVLDVNDNSPVFSKTLYQFSIDETKFSNEEVGTVVASDSDEGSNSDFSFSLTGTYASTFSISNDGVIITQSGLDYEQFSQYMLEVIAEDSGTMPLTASATILISVNNIDDECPIFSGSLYIKDLPYNPVSPPTLGVILTVVANDPDNIGPVQYSIVSGNEDGSFSMDSSSGNISLLHNDESIRGQYRLTVSANDQTCNDDSFALVEISIGSANEHSPVFSDSSCVATLSENPDIDTLVTILEATDDDVGSNGQVQYEIVSNIGDYTLFNVHPLSGNVTTTSDSSEYDREAQAGFQIGVTATDGGFRQDFCILDITLLDRNDNPPVFEIDPYETSLNDNLDEGSYVIQVQAQDPDFAENGKVLYYLTSPVGCPFIIDENTGTITLNSSIITQAECSLNVTAVDQGMDSLNTTATVAINIQSGNDLPVFKQSIYTVTIAEDYPATDIIIHLNATGAIVYNVLQGSDYRTNNEGNFNIYDASGGIYITSDNPVDYERLYPGPYSFRLFVTAANTAGAFSLAVVNINVTDINDNHPIFSENSDSTITFNVVENQHPGPIGILKAVDKDTGSNGVILYRLHETSDSFTVSENGTVSSLVQNLDAEGIDTDYTIYVLAYNDGFENQGDVAIVSIVIEDINDNEPSFAEDEYYIELNETHLVHSILLKLIAIDPDENDQNNLVFTIISGNNAATFQIESSAGIGSLTLKRQLDYESITQYSLQIQVNDGLHTDITTVIIDILDIDDEPPIFEQNEYNITVIENTPFGSQILTVQATDEDSDIILYEVRGLAEGRFYINSTGSITVIGDIDREEFLPSAQIVFLVFAFGGSLTTANIIVNISDVNDYVPTFILSPFYGTTPENTAPGSDGLYIVTVKAVDLDEGKNGTITYSLVSGENKGFLIDPVTGIVIANRTFDREAKKFFYLEARATDKGTPIQLFSTVDVIVEISDYNDNPPYWPYPYMFARVYENSQIGKTVIQLPANDPDNGINGSIIFSLTGGNELGKFSLNTSTGEITVAGPLDYEDEDDRVHFLYFSIRDAGNPSLTSNQIGELEIHVLDGNDHVPQFPNNNVSLTIPEDLASGTLVHTLTATDTDQGSNSQLTYSILNGNVGDVFIIQSDNSGVASIFSQSSLDYETVPFYTLTIIVTDAGYPSLTATVLINITITDLNDESPQFILNTYVTNLAENQPSVPLVLIEATDPDSDDIPGGLIDHYELSSSDNDDLTKFSLMADKWLYSTDNLDREQKEQYILTVTAIDDDPVNPMTGTATIIINILDVNDNPSDNGGHLDILIQSLNGLFPEQELGTVYFNDPDIDDIFSDCEIVSGDDHLFTVNNNCSLYTIQDNPLPGEYSVMIRGNDGMNPSVTSSVSITVENITTLPPSSSLITLTLNSSTSNYFSTIHSSIGNTLSSILSLSSSQINIISVQSDNEIDTVDINIAAVDSTGDYISQSTLIHKIYVSRNELSFDNTILYSLPTDLCVTEPCQNLGECQTISNLYGSGNKISSIQYILFSPLVELRYQCVCYPGTTGNHCEINYDDCYSNPCQYEASCTDGIQDFQCDCLEGTTGKDCSENPDECASNPCQNDATCINGLNTAICECPSGYYGSRCEYTYFNPSSQCDSNLCHNNGTCSPGRDSFTCLCTDDFTGLTCEKEIQFQGGCVGNPCYNGSTCIETNDGYVCSCSVGFTGPQCRFPLNNCELELCRNGATCETGVYGSYRCVCPIGFTGEHCTDMLPPCDANPCLNDGICINNGTDSYYCECAREHYGQYCQYFINPPDLCEDDPCNNSSICSSGQSTYTCFCFNGAGGLDCSDQPQNLSPCDSNPCFYGGKCNVINELNFTCECPVGYVGAHCEEDINECSSDPCESTGMCIDGFGSYLCSCEDAHTGRHCEITCPDGYIGEQCDIDIDYCSSSTCHNNGVCIEQPSGYSCVCTPVFTGSQCDITNNCTVNTCFNGGTCVNSDTSGHFCECNEQFTGEHCELLVVSFSGSSTLTSYRAYNGISFRGRGEIKFEFATSSQDGLLLLNTQLQKGDSMDFIAVEIIRGQLRVSYSLGDSPTNVTILSNSLDVTDGQWHTVEITINGKEITTSIDYCNDLTDITADCITSVDAQGSLMFLDLGLPLWLGGAPVLSSTLPIINQGINACIRSVFVSDMILDLETHVADEQTEQGCAQIDDSCIDVNCGNGTCLALWNDYQCICLPQFSGEHCDQTAQSLTYNGKTYAQYSLLVNGQITKRQDTTPTVIMSNYEENISLRFRTMMDDGVLLLLGNTSTEHLLIKLSSGHVIYSVNIGEGTESLTITADYKHSIWHSISIQRTGHNVLLSYDSIILSHTLSGSQLTLEYLSSDVFAAGRPDAERSVTDGFNGCLQDIRLNQRPLPTSGTNDIATVLFVGDEPESGCTVGPCYPNPCGTGNCTEVTSNRYQCICPNGDTQTSACESDRGSFSFKVFVIAIAMTIFIIVLAIVACIGLVVTSKQIKKSKKFKLTAPLESLEDFEVHANVYHYNEEGGEDDTYINTEEGKEMRAMEHPLRETTESIERIPSLPSMSTLERARNSDVMITDPSPLLARASTPEIDAFIEDKVNSANKDIYDFDSLKGYSDEGVSSTGSLSTICTNTGYEPYTITRLRLAGPEFERIADLLEPVLVEDSDQDYESSSDQNVDIVLVHNY